MDEPRPDDAAHRGKLSLVIKNQFNAFQDSCYPAHITALMEQDIRRIAAECGLRMSGVSSVSKDGSCSPHGTIPDSVRWCSRVLVLTTF